MDLKSLISKPNTETQESFWSITIEPQWVAAAIWKIENDAVKIIAQGPSSIYLQVLLNQLRQSLV